MVKKKKRNSPDLTLRNLRAMKKRIEKLERQHSAILTLFGELIRDVSEIKEAITK